MSSPFKPQTPAPAEEPPRYRPRERFWPYADLPEQPTAEELAALDPDLHAALFGTPPRPFSITLVFPPFDSPDYDARFRWRVASAEYREPVRVRRSVIAPASGRAMPSSCAICSRSSAASDAKYSIDDRPVPYARELWLPLVWFLIPR